MSAVRSLKTDPKRILEITRRVTDRLLNELFERVRLPSHENLLRDSATEATLATLIPTSRPDVGTSMRLVSSIELLRQAIGCNGIWKELSRVEEYDDRWHHAIRVRSNIKIDPTDALGFGRAVQILLLFIVVLGKPMLHSCVVNYEEGFGFPSPISLVCEKVSVTPKSVGTHAV